MWQLSQDSKEKKVYTNSTTGSKCTQSLVYTDKEGNNWYQFDDLFALPFTRTFAAQKITSLYALGLTKDDANNFFTRHKLTLKSDNQEKYEIAYAETLDFENKFKTATDPVKQLSALVPVYFTINDEPIDSFENSLQIRKMGLLEADPDMHAFFLKKLIPIIEHYTQDLNLLSQIAFRQMEEQESP